MGGFDDLYNSTSLVLGLGLGFSSSSTSTAVETKLESMNVKINQYDQPSLTLSLSGGEFEREIYDHEKKTTNLGSGSRVDQLSGGGDNIYRQDSGASSFMSNSNVSVKREREIGSTDELEVEIERVTSRFNHNNHDQDDDDGRKKLRLTKVQSALLEENFKLHNTLNPKQKQELARELHLRPRQVEVWFQNRRARTKLKQTEVDCEYLKKYCESLKDENQRLQKELQELKALKLAQPLYMQLPAATLTMCPSCERIGASSGTENAAKSNFTMTPKPHFYNPFTNQSAAC